MCGIVGLWDKSNQNKTDRLDSVLNKMNSTLHHRGPDDEGLWFHPNKRIGFGHKRLSILDLSPTGKQPMASHNGRYTMVYNGEVYNAPELKKELITYQGVQFKGTSDTEVILECIAHYGLEKALQLFEGMFAFALYDHEENSLFLARDRLGIKPLYWGEVENIFFFSSELKAVRGGNLIHPKIDHESLSLFLKFGYIPSPHTIYQNVFQLLPGHYLLYKPGQEIQIKKYWDVYEKLLEKNSSFHTKSESFLLEELETLLKNTVKRYMISDVPLGAFLSGGVDSSLVVSFMQAVSDLHENFYYWL